MHLGSYLKTAQLATIKIRVRQTVALSKLGFYNKGRAYGLAGSNCGGNQLDHQLSVQQTRSFCWPVQPAHCQGTGSTNTPRVLKPKHEKDTPPPLNVTA